MKTKICVKCGKEQPLTEYNYHSTCKDNKMCTCKTCVSIYKKLYSSKNKEKIAKKKKEHYQKNKEELAKKQKAYNLKNKDTLKEKQRIYYQNNKKHFKQRAEFKRINTPWKNHLSYIKQRCNNNKSDNYKYYGGRGIKCLITTEELMELWFRDKAYNMKQPSIDRKNNDGNYEYGNCKFIEMVDNIKKSHIDNPHGKSILQFDLDGNFIKEWDSIKDAGKKLKINKPDIGGVCNKHRKTAGKYIWRYKNESNI